MMVWRVATDSFEGNTKLLVLISFNRWKRVHNHAVFNIINHETKNIDTYILFILV